MLYTNICSGSETIFGPPDTVPGTLLRVGVGAMVRFPHVLQVSNCLDISWIYYTDRFEWNRAQLAPFHATSSLQNCHHVDQRTLNSAYVNRARPKRFPYIGDG